VPVLGDIPVIGRLFSTTTESVNNTETVVIITPRIVQDARAANVVSEKKVGQLDQASRLIMEHQLRLDPSVFKEQRDITSDLTQER
jgi:type II secretory pathway component GspD/PulD (secretin)